MWLYSVLLENLNQSMLEHNNKVNLLSSVKVLGSNWISIIARCVE